ncbi:NhaP-type Na+/H+ or K+/H+ antiporter [Kibdelosporangium banguiense]|uniref:NhaP-type Na+/H+ or K+/H+ antiporter n=1 Tax=Kibdelosporangium banguiense TaxID=1365924 RepID=A0ABS4TQR7_9PSEU|nr:NhaP-type Na+/H+ or K+/H+ antiporter [Kibdelosporangium banguiense]
MAVGLYASTHGIDTDDLRRNLRIVVLAVTLGVLLKVVLIGSVMWLFWGKDHLILAVVVAQIDPLSVAALQRRSDMSGNAKAVLRAWASFDDPVTILLTIYLSTFALGTSANGGIGDFAVNLGWNILLTAAVWTMWRYLAGRPKAESRFTHWRGMTIPMPTSARAVTILVTTLAVAGIAITQSLMLAVALIGLFARPHPRYDDAITRSAQFALVLAAGALGMALYGGIDILPGLALGLTAFGAQSLVSFALTWRYSRTDRIALALCQQNGLTAIILALVLEPQLPGTVAIVAPAILVINILHCATNAVWRLRKPVPTPVPAPLPVPDRI